MNVENVIMIPVDAIEPYREVLFRPYDERRLQDLVESIQTYGVLTPPIVWKHDDEKYEMLSGHNRLAAAKKAGLEKIPVYIKEELSEEEAKDYVIEANAHQRSFFELPLSEQAMVLKYEYESKKCQGRRNDIRKEVEMLQGSGKTDGQNVQRSQTSRDKVGDSHNMSGKTVERMIKLNYLTKGLKDKLDNKDIPKSSCIELAYLPKKKQKVVEKYVSENPEVKLKLDLAKKIRSESEKEDFSTESIATLVKDTENAEETVEGNSTNKPQQVILPAELVEKYFANSSEEQILGIISRAMENYNIKDEQTDEESVPVQ